MSRLTTNQNYCDDCDFGKAKECFFNGKEKFNCKDKQIYEKLREYEDLEEQGLLVRLPCKLGDDLYWIDDEFREMRVEKHENGIKGILLKEDGFYVTASVLVDLLDIDKVGSRWALLSVEQAEQKLKEMEREDK